MPTGFDIVTTAGALAADRLHAEMADAIAAHRHAIGVQRKALRLLREAKQLMADGRLLEREAYAQVSACYHLLRGTDEPVERVG